MKPKKWLAIALMVLGSLAPFLTIVLTDMPRPPDPHDFRYGLAVNVSFVMLWIAGGFLFYWRRQELRGQFPVEIVRRSTLKMIGHRILAVTYVVMGVLTVFLAYALVQSLVHMVNGQHYLGVFPTFSMIALFLFGGYGIAKDGFRLWKGEKRPP